MVKLLRSLVFFTVIALWACSAASVSRAGEPVIIFAASSLTDVMNALSRLFEAESNHPVVISLAATSVLARQIKDGAPAHVFLSANMAWMDHLNDAGLIVPESRTIVASNRLALAGAEGVHFPPVSGEYVSSGYPLADVAPSLLFAIGNPDHVPAGMYARQALLNLGLWQGLRKRLVPMPNARAVMANIDRGEVAGGFVYSSEIRYSENARIIGLFPPGSHPPIHYVAGIINGKKTPAADLFVSFLVSPEAESVFKEFGFLPPSPAAPSGSTP